jgi:hypothetical protein
MVLKKPICTTLLICILFTLLFLVVSWIFKLPILKLEGFYGIRNKRIRIYQSDDILDPDEAPEIEDIDPDDNPLLIDPDQQPMLDDQLDNLVLRRINYKSKKNSKQTNNF